MEQIIRCICYLKKKAFLKKYQIPLFVETTGGALQEETIETHREIADAIAAHEPLRAQMPCICIWFTTVRESR